MFLAAKSYVATWKGRVESVNRWHGARCVQKGKKSIGMIYEQAAYRKFKETLARSFMVLGRYDGYVDLQVSVVLSPRADTGNLDKPIGDALELAGVLENDRYIRNITYKRHYHPNSGTKNKYNDFIMVELIPVKDEDLEMIKEESTTDCFGLKREWE